MITHENVLNWASWYAAVKIDRDELNFYVIIQGINSASSSLFDHAWACEVCGWYVIFSSFEDEEALRINVFRVDEVRCIQLQRTKLHIIGDD